MFRNLLIAATLTLLPAAASASEAWTTGGVNFRSGPSTHYTVITTLPRCAVIHTHEWQDGWVRASWQGRYGWLSGRYVSDSNAHCNAGYRPAPSGGHSGYSRGY
ncbi:SH3 domain-containing protein [Pararhodobacter marinus]|uniref:SH3 domain-containing protein n=1 Tax=Pararhodobacter marinus TaxID=2184063 RepID=UPI003511844E